MMLFSLDSIVSVMAFGGGGITDKLTVLCMVFSNITNYGCVKSIYSTAVLWPRALGLQCY